MTTTKVIASRPPMRQAITIEKTNISGARTAMRIAIIKAIWTLVMSVVRRVTSEAVEKRSIFSKEKAWMRSNTSRRTLRAKPAEARAPKKPAPPPQARLKSAIATRIRPSLTTSAIGTEALISLTRSAVKKGISTSIATSPMMSTSVRIVGSLYSRIHLRKVFITRMFTSYYQSIKLYSNRIP